MKRVFLARDVTTSAATRQRARFQERQKQVELAALRGELAYRQRAADSSDQGRFIAVSERD